MAKPQLYVDSVALDNGDWRRIIGGPSKLMDPSGGSETFGVEFLIQGSTASETATRIAATEAAFAKQGARVQWFPDSSTTTTLIDWSPSDAVHPFVTSIVDLVDDQPQSVFCAHMRFIAVAQRFPTTGTGGGPTSSLPFSGQTSEFKIAENYSEEGYHTVAVSGHFGPIDTAGGGGTFTLTTVDNNGGYARFTLVGTLPAYTANMRIAVSGTAGYNGTHYISGISGQLVTTRTPYAAAESGLSASGVISQFTSGESLYNTARSTILTDYLGTSSTGAPSSTYKRYVAVEQLVKRDIAGFDVDFMIVSTDQPFVPASMVDGSNNATRGFDFEINEAKADSWFPEAGGALPKIYNVTGSFTIHKDALVGQTLYSYYTLSKTEMQAKVQAQVPAAGVVKLMSSASTINYTNNSIKFSFLYRTNWNGTLTFSRNTSEKTILDMQTWSDSKGFDRAQRPNRAPSKIVVTVTTRTGEGEADISAPAPTEAGFTFLERDRDYSKSGPYMTEYSSTMFSQVLTQTWHRYKFKSGAGSAAIEQVNPSTGGGAGGGGLSGGGAPGVK